MKGFARDGETERDLYFSTVSTARDKLAALRDLHAGPANANQGETSEIKSIDLVDQIEDLMQLLDLLTCVSG
jgi:hypothetical protein